jgi:hypothetical protein
MRETKLQQRMYYFKFLILITEYQESISAIGFTVQLQLSRLFAAVMYVH